MPEKGTAPVEEVTPESLGWQLRAALPAMRFHSISLCDAEGDVLWLSEGVLGPDEHGYVIEAIGELEGETSVPGIERELEDGRAAVFLPVRAPQGMVVGIAMILIDGKSITKGLAAKFVTAQVRAVLQRIAVLLKPQATPPPARAVELVAVQSVASPPPQPAPAKVSLPPEDTHRIPALSLEQPQAAKPKLVEETSSETQMRLKPLTSEQIDTMLTLELAEEAAEQRAEQPLGQSAEVVAPVARKPAPAEKPAKQRADSPRQRAVPRKAVEAVEKKDVGPAKDLALSVQQLLKLRSGGRTRRYEVLLRAKDDAERNELPHTLVQRVAREIGETALDEHVLTELLTFLAAHPEVWEAEPASFSINLSAASVSDEGFAQVIEAALQRSGVAPECIGFEIPQSCCVHEPTHVERFTNACGKLGCFIVLDDFTFDPRAVPLLRSKTLKLVKVDPKLTTAAMKDRVSQALVVAIAQASKVLGVHCVAKRVESQATREWLSATGIDFAQGFALEGPLPLEALLTPPEKNS
jgi:EAL domain-containing protein (putative c-di-GMP-specific phosphodiesterase class I)